MNTKRFLLALLAFALMLAPTGCAHHKKCCGDGNRSYAPPPAPCCNTGVPPAGIVPGPNP